MADSENLDELLAALASMGFEFEDCNEALLAGHTNLESAVEWLMHRKSQSHFKTHISKDDSTVPGKDHLEDVTGNMQEQPLTSRWTISDDAKKAREQFIEKEREQARTEAKKRKLEERRVRQQILSQIADDKALRKAKIASKSNTSVSDQQPSTNIKDVVKPKKNNTECLLKVRLPNGQVKTGAISITVSLVEAISLVSGESSLRNQEVDVLQPFPHKIFTLDELELSLESLGLHPSAMIVVQKRQIHSGLEQQAQSSSAAESMAESDNNCEETNRQLNIDEGQQPEIGGNERNLLPNEVNEAEIPADNMQPPPLDVIPELAGRHRPHQWPGGGMRLGDVEYNPHAINPTLPSSSPGESAERRMEMREQRLQHLMDTNQCQMDAPQLHREVRRLEDICIEDVALRVSGHPRLQPIASLGNLSNSICDKLLEKLMKSKALTPKVMNAFLSCCLRCIKLDCYLLVTNELLSTLRCHKYLTLLSLKSCPLITDKAMEAIAALKKLQSLNINQCSQLTDKCMIYIKELPSLSVLQMDRTKVTDEGISYFVTHAKCVAKLTHLSLCGTAISNSSLKVIKNLKSLKVLEMENTKIDQLDDLSEMTSLERLNVSHTQLTDSSICTIRHLSSLKSLNLLSTNISNSGLQQLHGLQLMLLKLPNRLTITDQGLYHIQGFPLTTLDLSDYINITDLGIQYISSIHSLTKLTLSNTRLTDVGLRSLSGLVDLVELNLDRTKVTDDGCAVIQNFQNLQILSLSSTDITTQMLLNGVLNNCIKLNQLNLSRTRVSNRGIANLHLPSLTLLNLDWTRVTFDCQVLLTGCPCLKALRTNNCSGSDDDED
ncbi:uncharacterized protein LOC110254701 [Exaiptasia diaphana]|uniref:UBX domain-containing protein n=1 Tax=Exaiptasia diaphana TaxID=2652724 RepID=A0A913YAH1_EXADI|nr:uncharacterized protein LOC110254701 [Exaiptasia diaphana]